MLFQRLGVIGQYICRMREIVIVLCYIYMLSPVIQVFAALVLWAQVEHTRWMAQSLFNGDILFVADVICGFFLYL